ncbi:MAG: copper homeostasis protein CutC [Ezakiella sp.]|nr:copper homeostasis protein CutC [Ezakiella sp.]MDD7761381.1 copper homeostasis protein CutC [Bacillota bacterium]MDY3946931.1 copper homeostasis protein CutC [Ezakiella sp.]
MIFEVCVDSLESAIIAKNSGADQVELVSLADVGGITPSYGMIKLVKDAGIKQMVMIRPRAAGFCYSEYDRSVMKEDIIAARLLGADGVVFGALNFDGSIDYNFTSELVKLAGDMEVVFHRAFEVVEDKVKAAKMLKSIGVNRILTKGGNSLKEGKDIIKELLQVDGIDIISGGVRPDTVDLIKELGLRYVHISSAKDIVDPSTSGKGIYFGRSNSPQDEIYQIADGDYLSEIIKKLKGEY